MPTRRRSAPGASPRTAPPRCTAATSASPARTARSASSSRTRGAPRTAIAASPTNFSSWPPCRVTVSRTASKYASCMSVTSSASSSSERDVNPTRSAKSTETTRRSTARSPAMSESTIGAMILRNGTIRTLDPALPAVSSLWIAGERIAGGVGVHETSLPSPETGDLGARCVLPGFTDSHVHFPTWALSRHGVPLPGCGSVGEALERVRSTPKRGNWLRGQGWRDADWPDGPPTRQALDAIEPERPAMLISKDYHALWLNSAALSLAGGDLEVHGGVVVRDESGEPTGVLYEEAAGRFKGR